MIRVGNGYIRFFSSIGQDSYINNAIVVAQAIRRNLREGGMRNADELKVEWHNPCFQKGE